MSYTDDLYHKVTQLNKIIEATAEMRSAQKSFFRLKTTELLNTSKRLERNVDKLISEYVESCKQKQGSLM